jgi:hypothetical protein
VEHEVMAEHRLLDALFADARDAFHAGDALEAARESFATLRDALETHFEQEDRLYYPAIWALRPLRKDALMAAVEGHHAFRVQLREIDALLAEGELADARNAFDALTLAFIKHERAEEEVLSALDRELAPSR